MSTFTGLESRIESHLNDELPKRLPALAGVLRVIRQRDLSGVRESLQWTPSVQIYAGPYRPVEQNAQGRIQSVDQTWFVVICVSNAADQFGATDARDDAGVICDAVLECLLGYRPGAPYGPLTLTTAPPAQWSAGGFGYYPLAFTSRLRIAASDI